MKFFQAILLNLAFILSCSAGENRYTGTTTVFVPYSNAARNENLERSPKIHIGFNGLPHYTSFVMDTGSVGIVASADIFTPAPGAQNLGPGRQYYSSSGIIEEGTWWSATEQIYDADGNLLAVAEVPVLRVTSVKCAENARFCRPKKHPKGIAMMGIGFGRKGNQQQSDVMRGTPDYNPFLNIYGVMKNGVLTELPRDWCNGYVVTSKGVYLGLTAENTAHAGFVKLMPWPEHSTQKLKDWKPAPMTVTVNGVSANGNILMDTGVGTAYFSPPPNAQFGRLVRCKGNSLIQCLPEGNVIGVFLPDRVNPVAFYRFVVGEKHNMMQPKGIHVVKNPFVFLNTSRHILAGIDFIYDNSNGYAGYIWNGQSSSDNGFVREKNIE